MVPAISALEEEAPIFSTKSALLLPSRIRVEEAPTNKLSLMLMVASALPWSVTVELFDTIKLRMLAVLNPVRVLAAPLLIIRRSVAWVVERVGVQLVEVAADAVPVWFQI